MDSLSASDVRRLLLANSREVPTLDTHSPPLAVSPSSPASPIEGLEKGIEMLDEEDGTVAYAQLEPAAVANALEASALATADKDKFWLKAFRTDMKRRYETLKEGFSNGEKLFWKWLLSPEGKPSPGHAFPAYNRYYRDRLFREAAYRKAFRRWFDEQGERLIGDRDGVGEVLLKHARGELVEYCPDRPQRSESPEYVFDVS